MNSLIRYQVEDGLALVALARPPVNALGQTLRAAVLDACQRAASDASVRAIILHGDGKLFSAGADISEFGSAASFATPSLPDLLNRLTQLDKPLIAALSGLALGAAWSSPSPAATGSANPHCAWAFRKSAWACCPALGEPSAYRV